MSTVHMLGISGTSDQHSYSSKLLKSIKELLPEGMSFSTVNISQFPTYNSDAGAIRVPAEIRHFRERVARSDAFLFVGPENDNCTFASWKNMVDWTSSSLDQPFAWKACAILCIGTSTHVNYRWTLEEICHALNLKAINTPCADIIEAKNKFDVHGGLIDKPAQDAIRLLLKVLYRITIEITPPERLSSFLHPLP
jgi:chromate reductase